jgi:hypothetical protein
MLVARIGIIFLFKVRKPILIMLLLACDVCVPGYWRADCQHFVDAVAVSLMMMKVMSVVSQSWTVQSIFCVTHVHSIKGAMNFTTDSHTLPSVTLHVSNPFANRMQMASIMPHDCIGKTLHKLWYKKKEEKEEAAVTCVSMLANKEKLLLSRNPRKQTLDVIASASSEFSHRTSSISLFCFGFLLLLN